MAGRFRGRCGARRRARSRWHPRGVHGEEGTPKVATVNGGGINTFSDSITTNALIVGMLITDESVDITATDVERIHDLVLAVDSLATAVTPTDVTLTLGRWPPTQAATA